MQKIILLSLLSILVTACGEEKVRTVGYYLENVDEMQEMYERCQAEYEKGYEPEGNFAQNCKNVKKAHQRYIQTKIQDNLFS